MNGLTITETPRGWIVRCGCNGYESAPVSFDRALRDAQGHASTPAHQALRADASTTGGPGADVERHGRFGRACSTSEVASVHAAVADAIGEAATGAFLDTLKRELGYFPAPVIVDAVVPALTIARDVHRSHRAIAARAGR